jgi:hypothetical protein
MERNQKGRTEAEFRKDLIESASNSLNTANTLSRCMRPRSAKQQSNTASSNETTIDGSEEEERSGKRLRDTEDSDSDYIPEGAGGSMAINRYPSDNARLTGGGENAEDASDSGIAGDEAPKGKQPWLPHHLDKAHQRILKLTNDRARAQLQYQGMKSRNKELRDLDKIQKDEVQQAKAQAEKAKEKNAELEKTFRKLQDEQLRLIGKDKIPCEPDSEVSADLAKIFRLSKAWTNQWSIENWTGSSDIDVEKIVSFVRKGEPGPLATARFATLMERKKLTPRMITNALINRAICHHTLQNPFKHLRADQDGPDDMKVEEALEWVVRMTKMSKYLDF